MKSAELSGKSERNSGIELLKIAAILLIILNHVVQTLCEGNRYIDYKDYILNLSGATTDIQILVLAILRYSGVFGNSIFFVCSAWFLLDSREVNKKKWCFMLLEIWNVSVVILAVTYLLRGGNIDAGILKKSLLPTTFSANWYMTCYLVFYLIHPALNEIINRMTQKALLKTTSIMFVVYIVLPFFAQSGYFYYSALVQWIAIYFTVAYMRLYLKEFSSNWMTNVLLLLDALIGHLGIILIINLLGLRFNRFSNMLLHWKSNNLFLLLAAIALLNLMRQVNWQNSIINHISKMSMLIYITHENIILRTYYRPYLINYVYENFGYQHIILWVLFLVLGIFAASLCASFLYTQTLRKLVWRASEKLYESACKLYQVYESMMLKKH